MSINDKKLRKQLFLDCGAIKDCEAVIVIEQIAEQSANAKRMKEEKEKLRKQLFQGVDKASSFAGFSHTLNYLVQLRDADFTAFLSCFWYNRDIESL